MSVVDLEAEVRFAVGRVKSRCKHRAGNGRKTSSLPAVLSPWRPGGNINAMPKPTPHNLRRFAEMPVARRAINVVKDRISSMDWQVRAETRCGR